MPCELCNFDQLPLKLHAVGMDDIRTLPTRSLALLLKVFESYNRRAGSERLEKLRGAWGDWIDNLFLAVGRSNTAAAATTKKSVSFNDVVAIFRTSERGNRSEAEVQTIKVATAPDTPTSDPPAV